MPCLFLEFVRGPIDDRLVPVVAAQVGIAVGGFDFDHAIANLQDADIEGAAAQVEDQDRLVFFLIQPISQGSSGRLVDDAQHFQPGDLAGIFGRLALAVVEICRDGDHRLGDRLAQVSFGVRFQLGQDHGRNFLRAVFLAVIGDLDARIPGRPSHHL